jgi:hypothetical protein
MYVLVGKVVWKEWEPTSWCHAPDVSTLKLRDSAVMLDGR